MWIQGEGLGRQKREAGAKRLDLLWDGEKSGGTQAEQTVA
jgi:hypothetical protein